MTFTVSQAGPSNQVREINASFPKVNNLEYFPLKVLLQLISYVDDIARLNLAETSCRFEAIIKTVFKDKYTKGDYFVIDDESKRQRELYLAIFDRFAGYANVKAIAAQHIQNIDGNHWMARFLQNINHLEKLSFDECFFRNSYEFLSQHMNITHLTIRRNPRDSNIVLPDFRNLRKLELSSVKDEIPFNTIEQIIYINPLLESLILRNDTYWTLSGIVGAIAEHSVNLKELILISNDINSSINELPLSNATIAKAVDALKHIETLGLTVRRNILNEFPFTDRLSIELFQRLGKECKKIQHLELNVPNIHDIRAELIEAMDAYENIEHFTMVLLIYDDSAVDAMLKNLPKLRRLRIELYRPNEYVDNLMWLQKYPLIERLTIAHNPVSNSAFMAHVPHFITLQNAIHDQHVKIEFEENGQVIGRITESTVVWRNKLLHWTGWAPFYNLSNINLLDLKHSKDANSGQQQMHPFEMILDYLDLESLHSLAATSRQCMQQIEIYVRNRSLLLLPFTITDEFFQHQIPQTFANYVNNLIVRFSFGSIPETCKISDILKEQYRNVRKLSNINDRSKYEHFYIYPHVRHFVCYSMNSYTALHAICSVCPDLEILECKNEVGQLIYNPPPFRNLRKFIFKYTDDANLKMIMELFQNTITELVPIV